MKLIGYIEPYKEFSSTIPIYTDGEFNYYHNLSDKFIITSFSKANFDSNYLIKIKNQKEYKIGSIGSIIFIAENNLLFIGDAKSVLLNICKYFDSLNFTKKYIQEEIFYYAEQLNIKTYKFNNKFQLKLLVEENYPIILKDISSLTKLIENYSKEYKVRRNRKSSFTHQRKAKFIFGDKMLKYDNTKIESYKMYFINYILTKEYRKAFHELSFLINYQAKVSNPDYIIKSICDISSTLLDIGQLSCSKTLLLLTKLFNINDAVAETQFAEILKAEGNFKEAKSAYLEIQNKYPYDIFGKTGYAEILKAEGNIKEAKALYIDIQKQFPENIVAKSGYAEILKAEGNIEGAKALYIDIQKQFPENIVAKCGYAEILKAEGNIEGAKALYLNIQQQFPDNIVTKAAYADILKVTGDVEGARSIFIEIHKQFPNYFHTKHSLLNCHLMLNEINKIDESIFIKSNPKSLSDYYFYHSYIIYNLKKGKYEFAEELILKELDKIPFYENKVLFKRTQIYIKILQSKFQELLKFIEDTSALDIINPIENIFKAHIYAENGKKNEAIECLNIIKKFQKNSIPYSSATLLSEIYSLNGLPKKGFDKLELNQMLIEEELKVLNAFT